MKFVPAFILISTKFMKNHKDNTFVKIVVFQAHAAKSYCFCAESKDAEPKGNANGGMCKKCLE